MRILIVGAGSIGQLYGYCFAEGGATVDVYVRPKYADDARDGFVLYDRKRGLETSQHFEPSEVLSEPEDLEQRDYDAVVLCIPSNGLRGEWIEEFSANLGDALVVSLTPGLKDREFLAQYVDDDHLATGLITAVAYPAPMDGESAAEPGTAYWFPPLTPAMFEGPVDRLDPVLAALENGGMKTRQVKNLAHRAAFGSAVLLPSVAVLETVDWSFADLRSDRSRRRLLADAKDEALSAVELHLDTKRPLGARFLGPTTIRGLLLMAPVVPPFDLETYVRVHFTKVGEQTRLILEEYRARREDEGLESPALQQLLDEIGDPSTA